MRVCIVTSQGDLAGLGKKGLLAEIARFIEEDAIDEIYVVSHRKPRQALEGTQFYFLWSGRARLKTKICHKLFRIIDKMTWIPVFIAAIPIYLCRKEITETLLGCDPDLIFISDLRWGKQLKKALEPDFPHRIYITKAEQKLDVIQRWRKYDPSPKVSIVLPTYNGSKYIRPSIESCLNQTYKNIELIVVDDGSSEDILGILKGYKDSRMKYFRHERNLGLAEALNTGFRNSTGDYLTWTSDDNYYAENAIEEMVRFLQTCPEVDFVYAENYIIDEKDTGQALRIRENKPQESLKVDNYIGACFLYKRKVYETVENYNPRAFLAEDYDYWVRISRQFRMQRLFRPLYYYRFHKDSLTRKYRPEQVSEKVRLVKQMNKIRV